MFLVALVWYLVKRPPQKAPGLKSLSHKPPVKKPPRTKAPPEENAARYKKKTNTIFPPTQIIPQNNLLPKPIRPTKMEF